MKPPTIGEIIEILKQYPSDALFLVQGYEGGYDIPTFQEKEVTRFPGQRVWDGDFLETKPGHKAIVVINKWKRYLENKNVAGS